MNSFNTGASSLQRFRLTAPILLIFASIIIFSSCLGPKKNNKWVAKKYGDTPGETKKKSDFITITSFLPSIGENLSVTEKKTSHLLPLLFYWHWDYKNTCQLNPQIAVNNFRMTVLSYANKRLKQKLEGQRIELTIEKIRLVFLSMTRDL